MSLPRKPLTYRSQENPDFSLWSEFQGPRSEPLSRSEAVLFLIALGLGIAGIAAVIFWR